jgi:hypothetical protein
LNGRGGNDLLFGGDGNDILTGGPVNDQVFGQGGNDTMIWNPGDGSDIFEGGDGADVALVNGGAGAETFAITANGSRMRLDRVTPAPFTRSISGPTKALSCTLAAAMTRSPLAMDSRASSASRSMAATAMTRLQGATAPTS